MVGVFFVAQDFFRMVIFVHSRLSAVEVGWRDPFAASLSTSPLHVYSRPALPGRFQSAADHTVNENVGVDSDPDPIFTSAPRHSNGSGPDAKSPRCKEVTTSAAVGKPTSDPSEKYGPAFGVRDE